MARFPLYIGSDDAVLLIAPLDVTDPTNPTPITTPTTAEVRIYPDEGVPAPLQDGIGTGDTFKLLGKDLFEVGERVSVLDNGGVPVDWIVNAVDEAARTITVDTPLSGGAWIPDRRQWWVHPLSTVIPMTLYGTPAVDSTDWGFRGPVGPGYPGLYHRQDVIAHVYFDGGTGAVINRYVGCTVVRGDT